ncbi:HAD family hydrolase [Candidatus Endomicrobiellum agilis]|uniref:HAD family hydrolase n=1 Tax=Candidatus Endomicrobiellum agilis TaxID=3238957 RepID=UPI003586FB31|nr:HAD family phosphatase [Endomicrobium sp.]
MSIKIAVFDLGNVIFKFDLSKFTKAYLKKTRRRKVNDFDELISVYSDVAYSYEKGNMSSLDFYNAMAKRTEYSGAYNEFSAIWNDIFKPIPETIKIVTSLVQNYQIAVLSNTNELHFNYLKECYPDIFLLFNKFFLSYEMHLRKPEDEIFKRVVRYYGILPSEMFYVDDIKENVESARNNGINAHLFTDQLELTRQLKSQKVRI